MKALTEIEIRTKNIANSFFEAKQKLDDEYKNIIKNEITTELEKLDEDEIVPLSGGDRVDGNCIGIGTYTDCINGISKDGMCELFNNADCEPFNNDVDSYSIFTFDCETQIQTLQCLVKHNAEKETL